jgi:hypothetical protein
VFPYLLPPALSSNECPLQKQVWISMIDGTSIIVGKSEVSQLVEVLLLAKVKAS